MIHLYIVENLVENGILYLHFSDYGHIFHSGNLTEVYVIIHKIQSNLSRYSDPI